MNLISIDKPEYKNKFPMNTWLDELFECRGLLKPNEKPLYTYQITESEYLSLKEILKKFSHFSFDPLHKYYWGACFCLYVSEYFRREYKKKWSWCEPEELINITLTAKQREELTSNGLDYWKRPYRYRENGHDWLGSLFCEGGLPWSLVQDERHGFGMAIRGGIKQYYLTKGGSLTTIDLISEYKNYLPSNFQNHETLQLLSGIVEHLMFLVETYPLKNQENPALYLKDVWPDWAKSFPLPVDEANAQSLINEWLKDAEKGRKEREKRKKDEKAFTCRHFLYGELKEWSLSSELYIPEEYMFKIDYSKLSTRCMSSKLSPLIN